MRRRAPIVRFEGEMTFHGSADNLFSFFFLFVRTTSYRYYVFVVIFVFFSMFSFCCYQTIHLRNHFCGLLFSVLKFTFSVRTGKKSALCWRRNFKPAKSVCRRQMQNENREMTIIHTLWLWARARSRDFAGRKNKTNLIDGLIASWL